MGAALGLIAGLLLGLSSCKAPARADLACVDDCERPTASEPCQCEPGLVCVADECRSCTAAEQCESRACNSSGRCEPLACALDEQCPSAQICDGGQCVFAAERSDGACGIAAVYFAFDSAKLTPNAQERLSSAISCLRERLASGGELILEGHADRLDGEELSERRAATLREFLISHGLPSERLRVQGKGAAEARGRDEISRAADRRVELRLAP